VRDGIAQVEKLLARRKPRVPQAALLAVDPRTGEILAMVGGRSYNQSQYNRAVAAKRQPGSVFKPFVYLAAFERALEEGRTDITPATIVIDEPTEFTFNDQVWTPSNYQNEYDGPITLRHALAHSRNIATIKVAEAIGFENVAALWKKLGIGTPPHGYPSIALGVFEATPLEMATAYTIFPNGGTVRPLRALARIVSDGKDLPIQVPAAKTIARKDTTYLVTNMMRSVLNEGTGAAARPRVEALSKALASLPRDDDWRRQADEALEVYTCGDQNKELKASADMLDLQAELFLQGPSAALCKALQKTARAHAGTYAAERAAFLATIAAP